MEGGKQDASAVEVAGGGPVPTRRTAASRRGGKRQDAIIVALRQCVLNKGYAQTSMTDIAATAKMSVSHLLYYYPTREAVLLDLARQVHEQVLKSIGIDREEPVDERIHLLVDSLFVAMSREELSLLREFIAVAAHDQAMQDDQAAFARKISGYLEDLFSQTPRQPRMSAADAAESAAALWMGLMINAGTVQRLDNQRARRIFRRALVSLANLDNIGPGNEDDAAR